MKEAVRRKQIKRFGHVTDMTEEEQGESVQGGSRDRKERETVKAKKHREKVILN